MPNCCQTFSSFWVVGDQFCQSPHPGGPEPERHLGASEHLIGGTESKWGYFWRWAGPRKAVALLPTAAPSDWSSVPRTFSPEGWGCIPPALLQLLLRDRKMSQRSLKPSQPLASRQAKNGTERWGLGSAYAPGWVRRGCFCFYFLEKIVLEMVW